MNRWLLVVILALVSQPLVAQYEEGVGEEDLQGVSVPEPLAPAQTLSKAPQAAVQGGNDLIELQAKLDDLSARASGIAAGAAERWQTDALSLRDAVSKLANSDSKTLMLNEIDALVAQVQPVIFQKKVDAIKTQLGASGLTFAVATDLQNQLIILKQQADAMAQSAAKNAMLNAIAPVMTQAEGAISKLQAETPEAKVVQETQKKTTEALQKSGETIKDLESQMAVLQGQLATAQAEAADEDEWLGMSTDQLIGAAAGLSGFVGLATGGTIAYKLGRTVERGGIGIRWREDLIIRMHDALNAVVKDESLKDLDRGFVLKNIERAILDIYETIQSAKAASVTSIFGEYGVKRRQDNLLIAVREGLGMIGYALDRGGESVIQKFLEQAGNTEAGKQLKEALAEFKKKSDATVSEKTKGGQVFDAQVKKYSARMAEERLKIRQEYQDEVMGRPVYGAIPGGVGASAKEKAPEISQEEIDRRVDLLTKFRLDTEDLEKQYAIARDGGNVDTQNRIMQEMDKSIDGLPKELQGSRTAASAIRKMQTLQNAHQVFLLQQQKSSAPIASAQLSGVAESKVATGVDPEKMARLQKFAEYEKALKADDAELERVQSDLQSDDRVKLLDAAARLGKIQESSQQKLRELEQASQKQKLSDEDNQKIKAVTEQVQKIQKKIQEIQKSPKKR